jgi:hypothetical protein
MPFGIMLTNDMWMVFKRFEWIFECQVYEYFILHSIVFSPSNTRINFPKFSLVFFANYAIPTYESWKVHCCVNQLWNICILTCFPNLGLVYMWILHVSCSTCDFGIIPMWVLHFEVEGPFNAWTKKC